MCAAIFNAILEHLHIKHHIHIQVANPTVPEDPSQPKADMVIDPTNTFAWLGVFNDLKAAMPDVCAKMIDKMEPIINKFGYSLRHPLTRKQSPLLADLLVPQMSNSGDCNQPMDCWSAF